MTLLAAALCFAGCAKKNDEAKPHPDTPGAVAAPAAKGAANAVNWEKVQRVPFARLQALLPEAVPGMKRTNLGGSTVPDGEATYSEGKADYEGANESSMSLSVQDHPVSARDFVGSKTTTLKGYPVVTESESSDDSELRPVVGDRFVVHALAHKLKVAQVKAILEKMDLAKLASWKTEGLK